MQSLHTQPSPIAESAPPSRHAVPVNHTRILSRFFLSSLDHTMQLKVTRASAAATNVDHRPNKPRTIPHSLYDDPAFSADPSSNPLCSASHDINYWPRNSFSFRRVTPIPPPNSPLSPHDRQQAPVSMMRPVSNVSPSSTSDLKTPNISQTNASSAGENKKRISLSFFKRKSDPAGTPTRRLVQHTKAMSLNSTTGANHMKSDSHSPPAMNGSGKAMKSVTNGKKSIVFTAQSARALDMIDELDESNPLGIPLHHGGPYEAIRKVIEPIPYGPSRALNKPERQQSSFHGHPFRFDVPLNLSPGQVLPHSVTAYYRPQVPMDSAISFHDRLGLQHVIPNQPIGHVPHPTMNQNMGSVVDQSSMIHTPPNPVSLPLLADQTQPINGQDRICDAQVLLDPVDGLDQLTTDGRSVVSIDPDACESGKVTDDRTRISKQSVTGGCQDTDDDQGALDSAPDVFIAHDTPKEHSDVRLPYLEDDETQSQFASHGSPRNTPSPRPHRLSSHTPPPYRPSRNIAPIPYGPPRNAPPLNMFLSPPVSDDLYKRQELPPATLTDHCINGFHSSAQSSSSSVRSSTTSTMTGFTAISPATSNPRNRILPRQLVMPAPLAKATASSRPQPTHLPQSVQMLRDMQKQHRVRFDDGTEYELPVTTQMNPNWAPPSSKETLSVHPVESQTRTPSIMRSNKLKKQKSVRGPEPPEILARLAAAPQARPSRKYMEPPATIPDAPKIEEYTRKNSVKRLLVRKMSMN